MSTRKRNKKIGFWVSDEEYEALENLILTSGLSKQNFILNACLNAKVRTKEEIDALRDYEKAIKDYQKAVDELTNQIRMIGNNINQLARRVHRGGMAPTLHELYDLANKMNEIKRDVNSNITFDIKGD